MTKRTRQTADLVATLVSMHEAHPDARIVTDVGQSMFSGWGDLERVEYISECDVIELHFR